MKSGMPPTMYWKGPAAMILDQRLLPHKLEYIACTDMRRVIYCIQTLATRGAPAIGVAAAMGLTLAAWDIKVKGADAFRKKLGQRAAVMRAARPTAVNLSWAVDRCLAVAAAAPDEVEAIQAALHAESQIMLEEDIATNRTLGAHGAALVDQDQVTVLTHCNAGALATCGYGTALGVVRALKEAGKEVRVIADETRPLLQGARLTAWEMVQEGIPVQVAPDSAVGVIMSQGLVDLVVVGADRIAANGDTANKVGTCNVALQAKEHKVPFYVAAPLSTVDLKCKSGSHIPIEQRDPAEVTSLGGVRIAPKQAGALNYAFDVTPQRLITGIITEAGVLTRPYKSSLAQAKAIKNR